MTSAEEIGRLMEKRHALIKRREQARKRRGAFGKALGRLIVAILVTLVDAWGFMFAVGIAHEHWIHKLPTIGYWWAVVIVALLRGTFAPIRQRTESSAK